MYKVVIVDDSLIDQFILNEFCKNTGQIEVLNMFSDGEKALKFIKESAPDFVFLDVHLPGLSGIKTASLLKSETPVIFVTSDRHSAYDAFQLSAIDFLLKPYTYDRFLASFKKVKNLIANKKLKTDDVSRKVYVKIGKELLPIKVKDILYIESQGDYILIKTKSAQYLTHKTLKSFFNELPDDFFFQVHRSFIVNLMHIEKITNNSLFCTSREVPISKYKRKNFNNALEKMNAA